MVQRGSTKTIDCEHDRRVIPVGYWSSSCDVIFTRHVCEKICSRKGKIVVGCWTGRGTDDFRWG
jgi:hypothetical protein